MPLDPTFFPRYDALTQELQALEGAKSSLEDAVQELSREGQELQQKHSELAALDRLIDEQKERIQLVSTHCFYGNTALQPQLWLRGGTKGKIQRAQAKLDAAEQQRRPLVALMEQLQDEIIPPLEARVERLQHEARHSTFLQDCQEQMRELAIEWNPSRTLKQLLQKIQSQEQKVAEKQQATESILKLVEACETVKEFYNRADNRLQEARKLNRSMSFSDRGHNNNIGHHIDASSGAASRSNDNANNNNPRRPGRHHQQPTPPSSFSSRNSPAENNNNERNASPADEQAHANIEARRERLKQQARDEFQKGVTTLQRILASSQQLPPPVRAQYPALCHPLERAARQEFRRVKNSEAGLSGVGQEILEHAVALQRQVQQDHESAQESLKLNQAALEDEKDRILQELRRESQQPKQYTNPQPNTPPRGVTVIAAGTVASGVGVPVVLAHPVVERVAGASVTAAAAAAEDTEIRASRPHPEPSAPLEIEQRKV